MSSFLLLLQCPVCLVRLIWMFFVMGGRWPYSCCFVECCLQDLFNTAHSILVQFLSSFFSIRLVSIHVVHPYSSINMTIAWKKLHFILLDRSVFHITDTLLVAVHAFTSRVFMSFSLDEMLFAKQVNLSISFREPPFSVEGVASMIKVHELLFCLHSCGSLCYLLLVPDYLAGIRPWRVYLPEVLCRWRSLRP